MYKATNTLPGLLVATDNTLRNAAVTRIKEALRVEYYQWDAKENGAGTSSSIPAQGHADAPAPAPVASTSRTPFGSADQHDNEQPDRTAHGERLFIDFTSFSTERGPIMRRSVSVTRLDEPMLADETNPNKNSRLFADRAAWGDDADVGIARELLRLGVSFNDMLLLGEGIDQYKEAQDAHYRYE